MSIIDTATGARPGSCCNYDLAQFLDWLLRFKDVAVTGGDFEVSRATDGITYTNDPSDDLITSTLTETGDHLGDDSDPLYSRIAGSLANIGSGFGLRPADPGLPLFEVYFRTESGSTGNIFIKSHVSCKGGFQNLASPGQEPVPVIAGDVVTRTWNVGIPGALRSNGFCTSGEDHPGFAFTAHIPGSDSIYASFVAEYCQPDTLDDDDPDTAKRDTYPWCVRFAAAGGTTDLTKDVLGNLSTIEAAGGSGWCTCFGDGLTTHVLAGNGERASARGRNTVSGREALVPLMFERPTSAGITRGGGWKGCSTWLTWCAAAHRFGENGNETSPTARERFAAGDVYLRCTGREIER